MIHLQFLDNWLKDWLRQRNCYPLFVGIIGSVASQLSNPNDCDILIVVEDSFEYKYWQNIQDSKTDLITFGNKVFNIPLHITVLSRSEIKEKNNFMMSILRKPIINIIGNLKELTENF